MMLLLEQLLRGYILILQLVRYNKHMGRLLGQFSKNGELPTLSIPTPEADNRAVSLIDPAIIALGYDEMRVGPLADSVRGLFEDEFNNAGVPFPPTDKPSSTGKQIKIPDPMRTGIVLWEYQNGASLEGAGIDRATIEEVLGYATLSRVEVEEIASTYHDPGRIPEYRA